MIQKRNSLDAGAENVTIRLLDTGFDLIEIKDDGLGISQEDLNTCCLRYYTSKINSFEELCFLSTYGFRGEALNSLCSLASEVSITTRTEEDSCFSTAFFNEKGEVEK